MASRSKCPERPEGHNWIVRGRKPESTNVGDYIVLPPLWRWCNFCHAADRETLLCEAEVRDPGRWPAWHTCGRVAGLEHEGKRYCKTHYPPTVRAKQDERNAKDRAKWTAARRRDALGWHGEEVLGHLAQLAQWAEKNADLVDADEWLGSIVRSAGELRKKLDK